MRGDLGHDSYEGSLANVAGLAPHIGAGDDQGPRASCRQLCVIGDHWGVQSHIQHGVPPLHYVELGRRTLIYKAWPHIPAARLSPK